VSDLRIAYFGSSSAVDGGSELCLLRMAKYFHEKAQVTVFLPDEGPLHQELASIGVDVVSLDFLRLRRYSGLGWLRWYQSVWSARRRLARELKARQIDLIHFNDVIDLPYYSVPQTLGIPALAHLRLILASSFARKVYRHFVQRSGVTILAVSQAAKEAMLGVETKNPNRIVYDPGPSQERFHPCSNDELEERSRLRKSVGFDDHHFVIVMVSKLLENKGHFNFIKVASLLAEKYSNKYRFLMVAAPAPGRESYQQEVMKSAQSLPAGTFEWIPGATNEEVGNWLRASDLFLHLPDTADSFPGVVVEAMSCRIPVVAYNVGGIPEQLDEGRAGMLIQPQDFPSAAQAIDSLRTDAEKRIILTSAAMDRVDNEFSAEKHFKTLSGIYEKTCRVG